MHGASPLLQPAPLLHRVGAPPSPPSLVPEEPEFFGPLPSFMLSPEQQVASQHYQRCAASMREGLPSCVEAPGWVPPACIPAEGTMRVQAAGAASA